MHKLETIEAFVEVVKSGSLSAAARQLRVSPSHISRLINHLEQRLDAQLLFRSTRQVRPTELGQAYYQQCLPLLDGITDADQSVRDYQGVPTGLLRITCSSVYGERFIAPILNRFMLEHPKLELDLHLTNRSVDIIREGYDLAIRQGVLPDSSLVATRLAQREVFICAAPSYLESYGAPHTLNELNSHNCLRGSNDNWQLQNNDKIQSIHVEGNWRANSGNAILDAALNGLGLAQLPDYYASEHIASGALVRVLRNYEIKDAAVWGVYPHRRHLSPKVRQAVDYIREHLPALLEY